MRKKPSNRGAHITPVRAGPSLFYRDHKSRSRSSVRDPASSVCILPPGSSIRETILINACANSTNCTFEEDTGQCEGSKWHLPSQSVKNVKHDCRGKYGQ
jgi:hypothetical protein